MRSLVLLLLCGLFAAQAAIADDDKPAPTEPPARLLVLGPNGRPLADARIVRTVGEVQGFVLFDPDAGVVGKTDADGLARTLPGGGRLVAWAPGLSAVLVPPGPKAAIVRLTPGEPTEGRVRLPRGMPAARAVLLALPVGGADLAHLARADAKGAFRFTALHRGRWRLLLRRDAKRLQTLGLAQAGSQLGERRPRADTAVYGRVLDGDGTHRHPVPGVGVQFSPLAGGGAPQDAGLTVTTDEKGHYRADGIAAGVYQVSLTDPNWVFDQKPPRIQAEETRARELPTWFAVRRQHVVGVVLDARDKPLHGVKLRLVPDPHGDGPPAGLGDMPAPVQSDPKGRFRIPRVTPAEGYRLMASLEGFSPWVSDPFRVDRGEPTRLKPVRLREGWTLSVRVRGASGAPVAAATVFATAAARPSAVDDLAWSAMVRGGQTDEAGSLSLADLPADDVLVFVRREGFLDAQAVVSYPRVSDNRSVDVDLQPAASMTVHVIAAEGGPQPPFTVFGATRDGTVTVSQDTDAQGKLTFTDLHDTAMDFEVVRKRSLDTVSDHVVLADIDNVVPGVEQHLEILLPSLYTLRGTVGELDPDGVRPTVTVATRRYDPTRARYLWHEVKDVRLPRGEREAAFEISGLPPGAYAVRCVQGALDSDVESVLIDRADVGGVELTMPAGARIAGTVLDPEGEPQIGVAVELVRMHGDQTAPIRGGRALRATTNEDGEFVFTGIAPGLWRLEARDDRAAPDAELVRVLDGEVRVTRDLVMHAGGTIEGTVEDGDERALDGLHVFVRRFDSDEVERRVRTNHEGRFKIPHVRPGTYVVRVLGGAVGRKASIEAIVEVEADKTSTVDFTARPEGTIAGTVRRGGSVVTGALVDLVAVSGSALKRFRTSTDAEGEFSVSGLEAGAYRIQLQSGAWRSEQDVELVDGDRVQLDLEAFEGRLRGTVVTRDGDPVPGAHITAWPAGIESDRVPRGSFVGEGRSDPHGAFILRGLPVGAYTLAVSAPGLPPGRLENAASDLPGADFTVRVVLGRGGDVALRVVDANDRGVTGARIWLEDDEGLALHRHAYVSGAAGRIRINGVPAGKVRLRIYARGMGRPSLQTLDIVEGRTTTRTVTVRPGGLVRLVVRGAGEDPLGRTRIDLVRADTGEVLASRRPLSPIRLGEPWGHVPKTGIVDIPDLEAGAYIARISAGRSYVPVEVPVAVKTGDRSTVQVTLVPRR